MPRSFIKNGKGPRVANEIRRPSGDVDSEVTRAVFKLLKSQYSTSSVQRAKLHLESSEKLKPKMT